MYVQKNYKSSIDFIYFKYLEDCQQFKYLNKSNANKYVFYNICNINTVFQKTKDKDIAMLWGIYF